MMVARPQGATRHHLRGHGEAVPCCAPSN